jgi:aminoglycoside 3'-phosphotransferase-2
MTRLQDLLPSDVFQALRTINVGQSGAAVYEADLRPGGGARSFVKTDSLLSPHSLAREAAVLRALAGYLPVPQLLDFREQGNTALLHMSAIDGVDASDASVWRAPEQLAFAYGRALQGIHALPLAQFECFDRRLDVTLAEAQQRLRAGHVDLDDLDDERAALSAPQLEALLLATRPAVEDLVVTHGDYCLPNVLFSPNELTLRGFVDLGRFGIADRHQDLALAERSLRHNCADRGLAQDLGTHFFAGYGQTPDAEKMTFYCLLDEFF